MKAIKLSSTPSFSKATRKRYYEIVSCEFFSRVSTFEISWALLVTI